MPVSPAMAEDLAKQVGDLYRASEHALLEQLAQALAEGIDSHRWAEVKLRSIGDLRAAVEEISTALQHDADGAIAAALTEAYGRGRQAAVAEVGGLDIGRELQARRVLPNAPSVDRLAASMVRDTRPLYVRITRSITDAYRSITARAAGTVLLGGQTRRQATQRALDEFAGRGITGFVDSAGRSWDMSSYIEMAVRSVTAKAAIEGHIDALTEIGESLVIVSNTPMECPLCLVPGTIVDGPAPTGRTRSEYTGNVVSITTASGKNLTGTPEHPVLTPKGWVPLKDLRPGDQVIRDDRGEGATPLPRVVVPGDVQVPTRIEEAGNARLPVLLAGPTRRDLNQDVAYRKVRYVAANDDLSPEFDPALSEPVPEHLLVPRVGAPPALLGVGDGELGFLRASSAPVGVVHGIEHGRPLFRAGVLPVLEHPCGCQSGPLFGGEPGHVADDAMVARSRFNLGAAQVVGDSPVADPEGLPEFSHGLAGAVAGYQFGDLLGRERGRAAMDRLDAPGCETGESLAVADAEGGLELLKGLAGFVAADEVVDVSVRQYSGHVWDLSTEPRWFMANGIVTHNCSPWEGEVLSINGQSGPHSLRLPKAIQPTGLRAAFQPPETTVVHVAGSLTEARAAGLYHPNCKHSLSLYLPGVTTRPESPPHPDGATYEDTQQQRYLERQVRAWKRREAAAMDDKAKQKARASISAYQKRLRELTAEKGLPRRSHREQLLAGTP